ncbi:hypothetical protein AMST5_00822 [freshwater sediment metagenome]|uniref:Uncharacterized protein n=1 Tax=freshwater sediment metagenome TaxID=556182 RepID=A0AA48RA38_9ZZZZ
MDDWISPNTALEHHFLNKAQVEREPKIDPDGVGDDLRRKAMALVADGRGVHPASMASQKKPGARPGQGEGSPGRTQILPKSLRDAYDGVMSEAKAEAAKARAQELLTVLSGVGGFREGSSTKNSFSA